MTCGNGKVNMRKLLSIACASAVLVGCNQSQKDENGAYVAGDDMMAYDFSVVEVSYNGNVHQYLIWYGRSARNGITHLPDCKYCK